MQAISSVSNQTRRMRGGFVTRLGAWGLALLLTASLGTGVFAQATDDATVADTETTQVSIADPGVLIVEVQPGSPAAAAGLVRGDILLTFNGEDINDAKSLIAAITAVETGAEIELGWRHGSQARTATVTLDDRDGIAFLGVHPYLDVRQAVQARMSNTVSAHPAYAMMRQMMIGDTDLANIEGVVILEVLPDSPAAAAELNPGDVIVSINGEPVTTPQALQDAVQALAPEETITLEIAARPVATTDDAATADEVTADEVTATADIELETVTVTLGAAADDAEVAFLGVRLLPDRWQMGLHRLPRTTGDGAVEGEQGMYHFGMRPSAPSMRGMMGPGMMMSRGFRFWMETDPQQGQTPHGRMGDHMGGRLGATPQADAQESASRFHMWRDGMGSSWRLGGGFMAWGLGMLQRHGFDFQSWPMFRYFAAPSLDGEPGEIAPQFRFELSPRGSDFF